MGSRSPHVRLIVAIRPRRLLAIAPIVAWLALGYPVELFPGPIGSQVLQVGQIAAGGRTSGAFALGGVWELKDSDPRFGGYSGLVLQRDDTLAAYGDMGSRLVFQRPDLTLRDAADTTLADIPGWKWATDVESATYDRASGTTWVALEAVNSIRRYENSGAPRRRVTPPSMADWPENGGPEAMARLPDGRFVVIAETSSWRRPIHRAALLFPGDPTDGRAPLEFEFDPPVGYDPTDAAALPDGRVVILLRALVLRFPPFSSKLVIADPAKIEAGKPWPWRELLNVETLAPRENYEGLAVGPEGDATALWLISDANSSAALQRTLLVKLIWKRDSAERNAPREVRRPRRPS